MEFPTLILILSLFLSTSIQEKIFGGRDCHIGEFPSIVSIQVLNRPLCGGLILDKQHILTAAHCLRHYQLEKYRVIAGDIRIDDAASSSRQIRRVSKETLHPNYTSKYKKNDIGIITLTEPLELNELISAAFLATELPKIDTKAFVAGWGGTENNVWSDICQTAVITIYPKVRCITKIADKSSDGHEVWIDLMLDDSQICAGDVIGINDTWYGDSGGPLYVMGPTQIMVLAGLTSYGDGRGPGITIYTYVNYFKEWIMNEISKTQHSSEVNTLERATRKDDNAANQQKNIQILILGILLHFLS